MKIEGYEEISIEEYHELPRGEVGYFRDLEIGKDYYFKKAQKFPICFEDEQKRIEVYEDSITIRDTKTNTFVILWYHISFPLLRQAMNEIDKLGLADKRDRKTK